MPTNNAINLTTQGVVYYNGTGGSSAFAGLQQAAGQLLIGTSIAGAPTPNTLSAGTGISITSVSGSITISATGTGVSSVTGTTNQILATPTTGPVVLTLVGPYTPASYTAHGVLVGEASSSITALAAGTNGQVLIGSSGADPAFATITSTGGSLTFTPGAHSLNIDLTAPVTIANGGTDATSFNIDGVVISGTTTTSPLTALTLSDGQIVMGSSGLAPVANTLTPGTGISIVNTAGSIQINATTGGVTSVTGTTNQILATPTTGPVVLTLVGPYTPASYTAHGVLVGEASSSITALTAGTNGQVLIGSSGADPAFATITSTGGSLTFTPGAHSLNIDLTAPVTIANGGTDATSFNIDGVVISGTTTTSPLTALTLSNGQIVMGSSGLAPVANTLTPGTGISIVNTAGSIQINATGGGLTWDSISTTQTAAVNTGYFVTGGTPTLTLPLPTTPFGQVVAVVLAGGTSWTVAANSGATITFGDQNTTVTTGTLTSTANGDSVFMVAQSPTNWYITSSIGNMTWT